MYELPPTDVKVTSKNPHPYSFSLLVNIKWTIKRIVNSSILDVKISNFLTENFSKTKVCLNLGSGCWTPYDSVIRRKSRSLINLDATFLALVFHPLTGKKLLVTDQNIYELLKNNKITSIVSFHTLPFIHFNLPNLLIYCFENYISFLSDISFQPEADDVSSYFCRNKRSLLIEALEKTNALIYDVSSENDYIQIIASRMALIGRYLIVIH